VTQIKDRHKVNGMTALTKVVLFLLSLTGVGLIFTLPYIVGHRLSRDSELEKKILPLQNKIRRMDEKKKENEATIEQLKKDLDNPLPFYQNNSRAVAQHNDQAGIHSPEAKVQTTKLTRELELVTASISGKVSNIKNMDNNIKVMQSVSPTDNKNLSNTKRREY